VAWSGSPDARPRLLLRAAMTGAVCCLLVYLLPFALGPLGLVGSKIDPAVRLRGWDELGKRVGPYFAQVETAAEEEEPSAQDAPPLLLVTNGRAMASELAFYMPQQPRVHLWNRSGKVRSQYDVWGGPTAPPGSDALIVTHPDAPVPDAMRSAFARVEPLDEVTVEIGNGRRHAIRLWRGVNLRSEQTAGRKPAGWIRIAETPSPTGRH
jgi:hypothetical protein